MTLLRWYLVAGLIVLCASSAGAQETPLATRLASSSYWDRMRAFAEAESLPPAEQKAYVPLLSKGLLDSDMEFRLAAVRALSRFGNNATPAIPAIVATLEIKHGEARADLQQHIARLGSLVVPALTGALAHRDEYAVAGACETLVLIGAPARSALPKIEALVNDPRGLVRGCAQQAVAKLKGRLS